MKCPKCNEEIPEISQICRKCGYEIQSSKKVCQWCREEKHSVISYELKNSDGTFYRDLCDECVNKIQKDDPSAKLYITNDAGKTKVECRESVTVKTPDQIAASPNNLAIVLSVLGWAIVIFGLFSGVLMADEGGFLAFICFSFGGILSGLLIIALGRILEYQNQILYAIKKIGIDMSHNPQSEEKKQDSKKS